MIDSEVGSYRPDPERLLHGSHEKIFSVLPETVRANFRHEHSENALLWNLLYPLAQRPLPLKPLFDLRPLWGTPTLDISVHEKATAYFWGYSVEGERLRCLEDVLAELDGEGPKTEVDLFLLSQRELVVVEAKHMSGLGRCSRYANGRCPEIHQGSLVENDACRYWEEGPGLFAKELAFGGKPTPDSPSPPCNRHYQLARSLLVGRSLAEQLEKRLHLWLLLPRSRWKTLEGTWIDFAEKVRSEELWRCLRTLAWESVEALEPPVGG